MKKIILSIIIVFMSNLLLSQSNLQTLVSGNNQFAIELFLKINKKNENLVYSPFSISSALAMVYGGAKENTEKAMNNVLHFGPNTKEFHESFEKVLDKILEKENTEKYQIQIANKLWAQKEYQFLKTYLDLTNNYYSAPAEVVDYIDNIQREISRNKINNWVEGKTNNKIKELINKGVLDETTRLVLTNAIYFFASWETQFDTIHTKNATFFVDTVTKVKTPFMNKTLNIRYFEDQLIQSVRIPYYQQKASLIIILPKDGKYEKYEKVFSLEQYQSLLNNFTSTEVDVSIPKYKIEKGFEAADVLKELGMAVAFDNDADFSGMTGKKELKISNVIHKAFFELNEQGTEAAAATAVVISRKTAIFSPEEPKKFIANRPFIFIITDNKTNSILFMGSLYNPQK